ncbi:MAG: aminopeptidase P family protein [Chloroflexi bacterium]|nr:aminopeptidase P family protein [Chloroflexota bacterium]
MLTDMGLMGVDWEERINFDRMRRERLQKAKDALARSDLDMLIVFRPEDVRYLTGFRFHLGPVPHLGNNVAVLPKGGDPILFTLDFAHCKARMPWLSPDNIHPSARAISAGGTRDFVERLKALVGNKVYGKVGVDIWDLYIEKGFRDVLPETEFVDGYEVLMQAKITKTADELECMRAANVITEVGFDAALDVLRPGVKECEVLAEAWRAMTALGSEWTQCANIVVSGPYLAPYRRFTSDRIIRAGDSVVIDIGGCYNGYWGDLTRTYVCGDVLPTKEQADMHQECYDALWRGTEAARPGNTNGDILKAMERPHGMPGGGHGAGISPWEAPWISGANPDIPDTIYTLRPGMCFSLEPYAGIPYVAAAKVENNIVVSDGEAEVYSTYPFDERLLDYTHPRDRTTGRSRRYPG